MNYLRARLLAGDFLLTAESFKSHPYKDSVGRLTNGIGNTRINPSATVTLDRAKLDCNSNLDYFHELIRREMKACDILSNTKLHNDPLSDLHDHQYGALLCFAFNCGVANWTIWRDLYQGKLEDIPTQLARFTHGHVDGKLVEINGLVNRRNAEIKFWNTADMPQGPIPAVANMVFPKP